VILYKEILLKILAAIVSAAEGQNIIINFAANFKALFRLL
jgi:hypothetical protein